MTMPASDTSTSNEDNTHSSGWLHTFVTDLFQNERGEWDLSRVMWAMTVLGFLANAAYACFTSHQFNAQDFGLGAGAILAAGGAGAWMHGKAP